MNYTIDFYEYDIDKEKKIDENFKNYIYEKKQEQIIAEKFMKSFLLYNSNLIFFFMDEKENKDYLENIINNYEFNEQIYIIHSISYGNKNDLIKTFKNFSEATHTNFNTKNTSNKREKYYIETILDNPIENKQKQIIHYLYYEDKEDENEDLFNTMMAKFKTANEDKIKFIELFKKHLKLFLDQIFDEKTNKKTKKENITFDGGKNEFTLNNDLKLKDKILIGDLINEHEIKNKLIGYYNCEQNNIKLSLETNILDTDNIKIKGEKKNGYNIIDLEIKNENFEDKNEKVLYNLFKGEKIKDKIYIPLENGNIDKFYNNKTQLENGIFSIEFPLTVFDNQTYTVALNSEESEDNNNDEEEEDEDD
jgi:hypothetical protein